jgi:hypothetical protein
MRSRAHVAIRSSQDGRPLVADIAAGATSISSPGATSISSMMGQFATMGVDPPERQVDARFSRPGRECAIDSGTEPFRAASFRFCGSSQFLCGAFVWSE